MGSLSTVRVSVMADDQGIDELERNLSDANNSVVEERHAPEGENTQEKDDIVFDGNANSDANGSKLHLYDSMENANIYLRHDFVDNTNREIQNEIKNTEESSDDPLSVLRSLKSSIRDLGTLPGSEQTKDETSVNITDNPEAESTLSNLKSTVPLKYNVYRCSTNIKSFKPTDFSDVIPSETTARERGRSKLTSHRIYDQEPSNNHKSYVSENSECNVHSNVDDCTSSATYEYNCFTSYPKRPLDKVTLANEMWFGKYRAAFEAKEYRRARSASPKTWESRNKLRSNRIKKNTIQSSRTEVIVDKDSISKDATVKDKIKTDVKIQEQFVPRQSTCRDIAKPGRHKISAKERRQRRVTIACNITSDIKAARNLSEDNSNKSDLQNETDNQTQAVVFGDSRPEDYSPRPLHTVTAGCLTNTCSYINTCDNNLKSRLENTEAICDTGKSKSKDTSLEPSPAVNSFENYSNSPSTVNQAKRLSARDKRKRNKTITGDITSVLAQARQLSGKPDDSTVNLEINEECKNQDDEKRVISNTEIGCSGIDKRARNKTISVDVREFLRQARVNYTDSANAAKRSEDIIDVSVQQNDIRDYELADAEINAQVNSERSDFKPNLNRRRLHNEKSWEKASSILGGKTETEKRMRYPCLSFNKTTGRESYNNKEPDEEHVQEANKRGEKRSHADVATKFRIPSFDEMLYNK